MDGWMDGMMCTCMDKYVHTSICTPKTIGTYRFTKKWIDKYFCNNIKNDSSIDKCIHVCVYILVSICVCLFDVG